MDLLARFFLYLGTLFRPAPEPVVVPVRNRRPPAPRADR